jgi:hypothetical protein
MTVRVATMVLLGLAFAVPAHAGIFSERQAGGVVVYSNVPKNSAADSPVRGARAVPAVVQGTRTAQAQPASFPRISQADQQQRDADRKAILTDELDNEQQLLGRARAQGAAPDVQHRHLSNIAALKRELAAMH